MVSSHMRGIVEHFVQTVQRVIAISRDQAVIPKSRFGALAQIIVFIPGKLGVAGG